MRCEKDHAGHLRPSNDADVWSTRVHFVAACGSHSDAGNLPSRHCDTDTRYKPDEYPPDEIGYPAGDIDARERLREKLPTSGLVIIDFAFDDWGKLHPQSGRLERYVSPKSLEAAAN